MGKKEGQEDKEERKGSAAGWSLRLWAQIWSPESLVLGARCAASAPAEDGPALQQHNTDLSQPLLS